MKSFQTLVIGFILLFGSRALIAQQPKFEIIQPELFAQRNSMTHAWADYDNDGDLDLYVGFRKDTPNRLYRNENGVMKDVAAELGVADLEDTRALAWGDYDADGNLDLYVGYTSGAREDFAKIACRIYRNDGKKFIEVTKSLDLNLPLGNARQLSWIDYDNDGDVDLLICFRDIPNMLFRNNNGKYVNAAKRMGITGSRATMGGVWFDYDLDGDLDLYLGNMDGYANRMYRNDKNGFVDIAPINGLDAGGRAIDENPGDHSMAGTIRPSLVDYDNDGDFDIFVTTLGGTDGFYRNDGRGKFVNIAAELGLAYEGYRGTAAWADYNNDGWVDLYAHGKLYKNENGKFNDVTPDVIKNNVGGYGSVWADYDNDGAMDLCISSSNHYILHNMLTKENARRSLKVIVVNEKGIYTKAGTEVRLYQKETKKLIGSRILSTGSDYNSQSAMAVHFGLPKMENVDVEITTMTNSGRKTTSLENIDPKKYSGKYLSIKVDNKGNIVKSDPS